MKKKWNFLWIVLIILIWIVAYSIVTNPYNQAKRDKSFLGAENASVTIISFVDYSNNDSASSEVVMKNLRNKYEGKIKFIYKYYNFTNVSYYSAMAAECAASQKKFEKMHDKLFENYYNITYASIFVFSSEVYLAKEEFRLCMENELYGQSVLKDYELAKKLKISVLPTVFINGLKVEGYRSSAIYSKIIDEEL
ncbi:thioredoxin domain-containing protein [Candidatus Woesearchaeota archaeon]|nr:thioredoxin domain-containing protein [Candidatus Woesearchaeota archaeon]